MTPDETIGTPNADRIAELDRLRAAKEQADLAYTYVVEMNETLREDNVALTALIMKVDKFLQAPEFTTNGAGGHVLIVPGVMAMEIRAIAEQNKKEGDSRA